LLFLFLGATALATSPVSLTAVLIAALASITSFLTSATLASITFSSIVVLLSNQFQNLFK
jgi:hypothetical protein